MPCKGAGLQVPFLSLRLLEQPDSCSNSGSNDAMLQQMVFPEGLVFHITPGPAISGSPCIVSSLLLFPGSISSLPFVQGTW